MSKEFSYQGKLSYLADDEAKIAARIVKRAKAPVGQSTTLMEVLEAIALSGLYIHATDDDYENGLTIRTIFFAGSGPLRSNHEKMMQIIASCSRFRIRCSEVAGEDHWLWLGEDEKFHEVSGHIVYPGEKEIPQELPVPVTK